MKIKLDKIQKIFKKLPQQLGERAFFTFLVLLLISLLAGFLVFYNYFTLAKEAMTEDIPPTLFELNEKNIQKISEIWFERNEEFLNAQNRNYPNSFFNPNVDF